MYAALTLFGTRPEIIKLAPVITALERRASRVRSIVVSSSQHGDLLAPLIEQFGVKVDHDLQVAHPSQTPSSVLSRCLDGLNRIIAAERPDVIIVQGDTTTALAGALAGFYAGVPVAHVEAGLRTGDLSSPFPEEAHRVLIARIARWHFAATAANVAGLGSEGIDLDGVFRVGNPVVDAVRRILQDSAPSPTVEALLNRTRGKRRIVLTTHRRENFGTVMGGHLQTVRQFIERHSDVDLIFPLHPNPAVREAVAQFLPPSPRLHLIEPMAYADFVHLASRAWLLVSDSGGIQEEAPTLGKPLVVLRNTTERAEAVECGVARMAGHDPARLAELLEQAYSDTAWVRRAGTATNPFGDGRAGERIGATIVRLLEGRTDSLRSLELRLPAPAARPGSAPAAAPAAAAQPAAQQARRAAPRDAAAAGHRALSASAVSAVAATPAASATPATAATPARAGASAASTAASALPKVTVVLPAYNEERDLPPLLSRIRESLERVMDYRVLVVDDGSKDATPEIVTAFSRTMPVTLIRHPRNGGLGAAIRTGLKAAAELDGTVVTLDADNSQGPELIPAMVAQIDAGADLVIASRFREGSAEIGVPRHRVLLSHGASWVLRTLIGYPGVRDYSCGYRAYRLGLLRDLIQRYGDNFLREHGFSCMIELLINARRLNARAVEVPLELRYDLKEGASKMRVMRTLRRYGVVIWRSQLTLARADESDADRDLRRLALGQAGRRTLMAPSLSQVTEVARSYGV